MRASLTGKVCRCSAEELTRMHASHIILNNLDVAAMLCPVYHWNGALHLACACVAA